MIRVTRKRLIASAVVLLLLMGILVVTWQLCDWPPPRLILKYGFPPAGGPTGRRMTVEGTELVELSTGYFRMGAGSRSSERWLFEKLLGKLGIGQSVSDRPLITEPPRWVEIEMAFWMSTKELTNRDYLTYVPHIDSTFSRKLPTASPPPAVACFWHSE